MHLALAFSSLLLTFFGGALSLPSLADDEPTSLRVRGVTYGGSACPQGTVGQFFSVGSPHILTVLLDNFGYLPNEIPANATAVRKNCMISVDLLFEPNWQVQVASEDFHCYQDFPSKDISYRFRDTIYYSGGKDQEQFEFKGNGPINGFIEGKVNTTGTLWSPCGNETMVLVSMQAAVTSNSTQSRSVVQRGPADAGCLKTFALKFRKC